MSRYIVVFFLALGGAFAEDARLSALVDAHNAALAKKREEMAMATTDFQRQVIAYIMAQGFQRMPVRSPTEMADARPSEKAINDQRRLFNEQLEVITRISEIYTTPALFQESMELRRGERSNDFLFRVDPKGFRIEATDPGKVVKAISVDPVSFLSLAEKLGAMKSDKAGKPVAQAKSKIRAILADGTVIEQ